MNIKYDREADVLYVSTDFALDCSVGTVYHESEDEIVYRYNRTTGKLRGFTIPHLSVRDAIDVNMEDFRKEDYES